MKPVELTATQKYDMEVMRVAFMQACPFFAHYFYAEMRECPTRVFPTAATDGRTIFYNPDFFESLKPEERVFVFAHEVHHVICRHPQRMKHYRSANELDGVPWVEDLWQEATDYVINADLVETKIGSLPPSGYFDKQFKGSDLAEDVYKKLFKQPPPSGGGGGGAGPPQSGGGRSQISQSKGNQQIQEAGGRMDEVLAPPTDPATGREDVPDPHEFQEAVARAAAAAKAMGKMPGSLQRLVDEILEPQVDWREHLRLLVTGRIGSSRETWNTPNRRRLVLNPLVMMPGRRGFGAGTVACVVDNSASIGERELSAFFGELSGIMADVRPREVVLIWCDAKVQQVDQARTLDELAHIRVKGSPGGGGTNFIPPFEWLDQHNIRPDALVYITDMVGEFPERAPAYPVIWCASTNLPAPWGDVVRIKVS